MSRDERFMREALAEALEASSHGDVPVGALVVQGDEILARTHNTQERDRDATAHAELLALTETARHLGSYRLVGCELYTTLEPCPMCAGAVVWHRVERLVVGAWNPKAGAAGSLYNIPDDPRLNHRVEVVRGVLARECAEPLGDFFEGLRGYPE